MRTLVVSDLHFGQPGRFRSANKELFKLIHRDKWDRLVLLGDVFDLWHYDYCDIVEQNKDILLEIDVLPYEVIYIPGNHDAEFKGMRRLNNMRVAAQPYNYSDGGKSIVLAHGNEFDTFSGTASKMASWVAVTADKVACYFMGPGTSIQRKVRHSFAAMNGKEKYAEPIADRAMENLLGDIVVLGHTHIPEVREYKGRMYLNSGSFGPEGLTYVKIVDGNPELCYI